MWLFLAFLGVPLIEIALFIQVGGLIGLWPTLLIVVLTAIIGTWLVRSQGRLALNNLRGTFNRLEDPSEPLAHGAMILVAGALLLTPGFFTDAVGFALLVPGVRSAVFRWLARNVAVRRFEMGEGPRQPGPNRPGGPRPAQPRNPSADVIDGDYSEVDPPKRPTHEPSGWTKH